MLLRNFAKFQYLFETELIKELCKNGTVRTYKVDDLLMDIGANIDMMPIALSGSIKVMKDDKEGNELLLYYLESGDTCAITISCCAHKAKSSIRAIAETETNTIFIPIHFMEEWLIKYKFWRRYVLNSYHSRLEEMVNAIDNLVFNSMKERLVNYINDKVWVNKNPILEITHQGIGQRLALFSCCHI